MSVLDLKDSTKPRSRRFIGTETNVIMNIFKAMRSTHISMQLTNNDGKRTDVVSVMH